MPVRRNVTKQVLLLEHLETTLSLLFEMEGYRRHMLRAPHCTAALLAPGSEPVQKDLLAALKLEWDMVVRMESQTSTASLLHGLCPYTRFQNYREVMTSLNQAGFELDKTSRDMILAWHPSLSQSANIEDIFNSCEDACRRTKSGAASMPNLSTVAMRGVMKKVCNSEGQARTVQLNSSDFEGPEVQGLKPKLFTPDSFAGGHTEGTITTGVFFKVCLWCLGGNQK